MSVTIIIPARFASSRYPGKPLASVKGADGNAKPLIRRSWEAACRVGGVSRVLIATDDDRIGDAARGFGAEVVMTPSDCSNGTERCAAAMAALDLKSEIFVNFQGDALLTPPQFVEALIQALVENIELSVATPALSACGDAHRRLVSDQAEGRVGGTTVVTAANDDALYFSKAVIPHIPIEKVGEPNLPIRLHVGVYAYRANALSTYQSAAPSPLETLEGLEQLRFLHLGIPVRVVNVDPAGADIWELNNPVDLAPIERELVRRGLA